MVDKRSALNQGQVDILELLYKYRFGSRQLIADSLKIKAGSSLHEKLTVLIKHGLVAMRQEKRSKLYGIPAAYFLTPSGLRALQALDSHDHVTESIIKSCYRDRTVSQTFVNHTLDVYKYTNLLKRDCQDLGVYLRRDMSQFSYFPETPPDAFISFKQDGAAHRFFVDIIPDNLPRNLLDRRVTGYAEFFDEGGWDATGSDLPKLLFINEKGTTERRVRRAVQAALNRVDMTDEIEIYTTTYAALQNAVEPHAIWTSIDDPDELLPLGAL